MSVRGARPLVVSALLGLTILVAALAARRDFARQGDGWEYLIMVEAWVRHGSPDVREGDIAAVAGAVDAWLTSTSGPTKPGAVRAVVDGEIAHRFVTTPGGQRLAVHFWLYPLVVVPARWVLDAVGGWPFNALVVTNVGLVALALAAVLVFGPGDEGRRRTLAVLLLATPVVWYVLFTGTEVFSWTCAVLSLVALERGRHGTSSVLAGLGATQHPAMAPLALVPVALALVDRNAAAATRAAAGAGLALLPLVDHTWRFGRPGLLLAENASAGAVTIGRFVGMLTDLNVGLLPYVPVLLLALPVAAWHALRTRDATRSLLLAALVAMMAGVQVQQNWNSAGMGLQRYLLWMLPVLTWIVAGARAPYPRAWLAAASVATSVVVLADWPAETNWLEHRPVARWVLQHAPALYAPEFELFAERAAHAEAPPAWMRQGRADGWRELLPVAVGHASGEVTVLLVDRESAPRLPDRFVVAPDYWPALQRIAAQASTPVYVYPAPGAVRSRHDPVDGAYHAGMQAAERVR